MQLKFKILYKLEISRQLTTMNIVNQRLDIRYKSPEYQEKRKKNLIYFFNNKNYLSSAVIYLNVRFCQTDKVHPINICYQ